MTKRILILMILALATGARAQSVYSQAQILDFYGQPAAPANPPTNFGRVYFDTTSATMKCLTTSGGNCFSGSSGTGTVNAASQYSVPYYSASGSDQTLSGLAAPTANGLYQLVENVTASAAVAPTFALAGAPINAQTGTSYTFLYSDRGSLVTFSNGSSIAVTLPQAGSTGFTSSFFTAVLNKGAGAVTITPTTSTISVNGITGAATFVLRSQQWALIYSDGNNYFAASPSYAGDGAQANPSISFANQTGSGFYQSSGNVQVTRQGGDVAAFNSTGLQVPGTKVIGFAASGLGSYDTAFSRGGAGLVDVGTGAAASVAGFIKTAQTLAITSADVTCGTGGTISSCVAFQTITGLSVALPSVAANWSFDCTLIVGQATAAAADQIGVQTAVNGATNLAATGIAYTAAGTATTASITGVGSTTTAQSVVTFTPGATGTKLPVEIKGTIEGASASGTTLNIVALTGAAADLLTIYRGSTCQVY